MQALVWMHYFQIQLGTENIATANFALRNSTTGRDNIAAGLNSLINSTTGSGNTAFGNFAGDLVTSGDNNTFTASLGPITQPARHSAIVLPWARVPALLRATRRDWGSSTTTSIGAAAGWHKLFSDGRFKKCEA